MKKLRQLIIVLVSLFAAFAVRAADEVSPDPAAVAEKFYAGYVAQVEANRDTRKWVANSKLVTGRFKKAYAKAMSGEVDADPVLNAQDVPTKPFKAGKPEIKDAAATVVLTAAFGEQRHQVKAARVRVNGVWLLDAVK